MKNRGFPRLHAEIDKDLEMKFRQKILGKFGAKKAALREALEEAIRLWLKE